MNRMSERYRQDDMNSVDTSNKLDYIEQVGDIPEKSSMDDDVMDMAKLF